MGCAKSILAKGDVGAKGEQRSKGGGAAKKASGESKDAASCQAKLAATEESLAGSDVQAVLALRRNTLQGIATVKEYSGKAYEEASKAAVQASESYEVYSNLAQAEAERVYKKAIPVVEDTHKKCLEAVQPHYDAAIEASVPHIETAKQHFRFSLTWLSTKLESGLTEAAVHVPVIKPHVGLAARVGAHLILLAPIGLIALFVFCNIFANFAL